MTRPDNVAPVTSTFHNAGADFIYTFPADSMTVLRIRAN
jgi:methionine synthase I (cobalamin-dependent)